MKNAWKNSWYGKKWFLNRKTGETGSIYGAFSTGRDHNEHLLEKYIDDIKRNEDLLGLVGYIRPEDGAIFLFFDELNEIYKRAKDELKKRAENENDKKELERLLTKREELNEQIRILMNKINKYQ